MSDQLVAEAASYTTHNKHERRTSMSSAGFDPAITQLQAYVSDRTATGIGCLKSHRNITAYHFVFTFYCHAVNQRKWLALRRDVWRHADRYTLK